jgi:hypothetical protein
MLKAISAYETYPFTQRRPHTGEQKGAAAVVGSPHAPILNAWGELAKPLKRKSGFPDTQTESHLVQRITH